MAYIRIRAHEIFYGLDQNFDISITNCFSCFFFSLDFCTMELGYKMMTPQHHLIWRTMVCCSKDSLFHVFELLTHFIFLNKTDTIDVMVERKFVQNFFLTEKAQSTSFYVRGWRFYFDRTLGLVEGAAFDVPEPEIKSNLCFLITFAPWRSQGNRMYNFSFNHLCFFTTGLFLNLTIFHLSYLTFESFT